MNLELQIRTGEPRYLLELVFGTVDIIDRVGCQPVQFIQLLRLLVHSIGGREDERRTDDAGVLGVSTLEISGSMCEMLRGTDLKPVGDMPTGVDTQAVTLIAGVLDDTGCVRIAA